MTFHPAISKAGCTLAWSPGHSQDLHTHAETWYHGTFHLSYQHQGGSQSLWLTGFGPWIGLQSITWPPHTSYSHWVWNGKVVKNVPYQDHHHPGHRSAVSLSKTLEPQTASRAIKQPPAPLTLCVCCDGSNFIYMTQKKKKEDLHLNITALILLRVRPESKTDWMTEDLHAPPVPEKDMLDSSSIMHVSCSGASQKLWLIDCGLWLGSGLWTFSALCWTLLPRQCLFWAYSPLHFFAFHCPQVPCYFFFTFWSTKSDEDISRGFFFLPFVINGIMLNCATVSQMYINTRAVSRRMSNTGGHNRKSDCTRVNCITRVLSTVHWD